ncbi:MAG: galactose oxidase [Gammaproteobacteria bacterium]|jgi:N-acetylneuraminic acid mutarotase|nr:galactose oxidase [Gammaproteobacteria bacterium]
MATPPATRSAVAALLALWLPLQATGGGEVPPLPVAVSNNAVAAIRNPDGSTSLFSFLGLLEGKSRRDVTNRAFSWSSGAPAWKELPPVPGRGRLAGVAVTVGQRVFLFGGYTVGEDHSEVSTAGVFAFDPSGTRYLERAPMPIPVDDSIALAYRDRWVYLVSGWHDKGNVSQVQVYDTQTDRWQQATPYPGAPVFGHAGGLVGNQLLVADGVRVAAIENGKRRFEMSAECWVGTIDPADPFHIRWRRVPAHPGPPRYRMAAGAGASGVLFVGGSANPYNFNGIGYNGVASEPATMLFAWDFARDAWRDPGPGPATMDHRGLVRLGDGFLVIGGMGPGQHSLARVTPVPGAGH